MHYYKELLFFLVFPIYTQSWAILRVRYHINLLKLIVTFTYFVSLTNLPELICLEYLCKTNNLKIV